MIIILNCGTPRSSPRGTRRPPVEGERHDYDRGRQRGRLNMGITAPTAPSDALSDRYPTPFLTILFSLRRRRSVPEDLFYAYWRDVHCQISARLPGMHQLWIHFLDYEHGRAWPQVPGIARELDEADRFEGVPEPVFLTEEDVNRFGAAMSPLMNDELNIFEETIGYQALGANSRTVLDRLPDPAPDLPENALRFLIFIKQAEGVDSEGFRLFMTDRLAPAWAGAPELLKLRMHLFEPYMNEDLLMDAQELSHYKAPKKQYQACLEVVFADALAVRRFAASPAWLADEQRAHIREQHAFEVVRRYTMRYGGQMTVTGLRGAAEAELIHRVGAINQLAPDVVDLLGGY
jgi:hypothetical protein